jgi:hypothetical protein
MNRLFCGLSFLTLLLIVIGTVRSIPYILRQPKTYEHVVKGTHALQTISPARLQAAMDENHRRVLYEVIKEVEREKTGFDRINMLQNLTRVSFEVPKYEDIDTIFKNIELHLYFLTKQTVNVFDQLLPSINIVHNYFALLEDITIGENKKIFKKLHDLFRTSLLAMARETYGQANFYQAQGQTDQAHELMNIAQALVFRLKETNSQAKALYNEIEAHQPVPFIKELQELGALATGGLT